MNRIHDVLSNTVAFDRDELALLNRNLRDLQVEIGQLEGRDDLVKLVSEVKETVNSKLFPS